MLNKSIRIKESLKRVKTNYSNDDKPKTEIMIGTPKTKKSDRQLPMYSILEKILKKQQIYQIEDNLKFGDIYNSNGFVFTNEIGKHLD